MFKSSSAICIIQIAFLFSSKRQPVGYAENRVIGICNKSSCTGVLVTGTLLHKIFKWVIDLEMLAFAAG